MQFPIVSDSQMYIPRLNGSLPRLSQTCMHDLLGTFPGWSHKHSRYNMSQSQCVISSAISFSAPGHREWYHGSQRFESQVRTSFLTRSNPDSSPFCCHGCGQSSHYLLLGLMLFPPKWSPRHSLFDLCNLLFLLPPSNLFKMETLSHWYPTQDPGLTSHFH